MELRMLRYLLDHRGSFVGQAELLEQVWGYSKEARSRTVYATVYRLRQVIEDDPSSPRHLESVAGQGFRFTLPAPPSCPRIRAPLDAFVGRGAQLAQLDGTDARLITIFGPGGAGKTRLVQEFADRAISRYPGGQWFVDLSRCRTVSETSDAVASALQTALKRPEAQLGQAIDLLGRVLVVLDGAESVEEELGPALLGWLHDAPRASFVATSRRRIRVRGEFSLHLGPLSPPPGPATLEERRSSCS
ncbi:MAG: winged helix-turn-helix domain-containing protein [Myxococcota bacterium]